MRPPKPLVYRNILTYPLLKVSSDAKTPNQMQEHGLLLDPTWGAGPQFFSYLKTKRLSSQSYSSDLLYCMDSTKTEPYPWDPQDFQFVAGLPFENTFIIQHSLRLSLIDTWYEQLSWHERLSTTITPTRALPKDIALWTSNDKISLVNATTIYQRKSQSRIS